MCHFHQVKIVRRYLTKQPALDASKELLDVIKLLAHTDKACFVELFQQWEAKWADFLKERATEIKTNKTYYVHKRLRSAYLSIKRNMPYLWTMNTGRYLLTNTLKTHLVNAKPLSTLRCKHKSSYYLTIKPK
jgi:hypothetical protein